MVFNKTRFKQLQEEELQIAVSKNQDYGNKNITMTGLTGVIVRLIDKAYRADNLAGGAKANHEDIRQNLKDIANYCNIALMVEEGSWDKNAINMVYLAGPIDAVIRPEALGWREELSAELRKFSITTFDPCAAFRNGELATAENIREINRAAIRSSDVMVAKLPHGVPSVGTYREIEYAKSLGKPVIAWTDSETMLSRHLDSYDLNIAFSMSTVIQVLIRDRIADAPTVHFVSSEDARKAVHDGKATFKSGWGPLEGPMNDLESALRKRGSKFVEDNDSSIPSSDEGANDYSLLTPEYVLKPGDRVVDQFTMAPIKDPIEITKAIREGRALLVPRTLFYKKGYDYGSA